MNPSTPVYVIVETPAQRALRQSLNWALDFVFAHLHWWPQALALLVAAVVLTIIAGAVRSPRP